MTLAALPLTEKEFQARVTELAKLLGWRFAHFRPALTARGYRTAMIGDTGFPDLVLVRPPRIIFAELKVGAPLADEQKDWLADLGSVPGVEAVVWRPRDMDSIVEALRPGR